MLWEGKVARHVNTWLDVEFSMVSFVGGHIHLSNWSALYLQTTNE